MAGLRQILADLPDEAVVVVAGHSRDGSLLADLQECWYLPRSGDCVPLGRDGDGNVREPGPDDL